MSAFTKFLQQLLSDSPKPDSDSLRKELARLVAQEAETARRFEALEKTTAEAYKAVWDGHKTFIAVALALGAVFGGFLTYLSRQDVKDANSRLDTKLQHFEERFSRQEEKFEKRFADLAGTALKKPALEISTSKGALDGQEFEISGGDRLPFYPLFLKNTGDRKTDPISVRLYTTASLIGMGNGVNWVTTQSNDKEYSSSYFLRGDSADAGGRAGMEIAPKETWTFELGQFTEQIFVTGTNRVDCKLLVFYGTELPCEAKFVLKFK